MKKWSDEEIEKENELWARFLFKQFKKFKKEELSKAIKRGIKASKEARSNESIRSSNRAN